MSFISIVLYLSPASLCCTSGLRMGRWVGLIETFAWQGHVSLFFIDKAHCVQQSGQNFRPKFITAVNKMKLFVQSSPIYVIAIAMSATFHKIDRCKVAQLLGITNPTMFMGVLTIVVLIFNVLSPVIPAHQRGRVASPTYRRTTAIKLYFTPIKKPTLKDL